MKYSQHIIFFTGDFVYIIAQGILPGKSVPSRSPEFSKHCQLLKKVVLWQENASKLIIFSAFVYLVLRDAP